MYSQTKRQKFHHFSEALAIRTSLKVLKTAKRIVIVKVGRNVQYEGLLKVGYFNSLIGSMLLIAAA